MAKKTTRVRRKMKSMEVVPPPTSIAGIRIAFEVTGSQRGCSFKAEEAEQRLMCGKRERLASKCSDLNVPESEANEVLDLTSAILSGDLQEVQLRVQHYLNAPWRLASIRDHARDLLAKVGECKIDLIPSKPFRTSIAGIQTDVISIILKEKSTDVMIFVASHPGVPSEVYSIKKSPNGISELEYRKCDAAQLFQNISKTKKNN